MKPKMYAARRALPNDSSVSVSADESSRKANLTAPIHPGSNASVYIVVRFDSSDTLALEANLPRPDDDNGKRIDSEQARFQQFKVTDGERPSIEKWVDDQLVSLVPELLRACS